MSWMQNPDDGFFIPPTVSTFPGGPPNEDTDKYIECDQPDGCDQLWGVHGSNPDDFEPHLVESGWQFLPNGKHLCPDHAAVT